MSNLSMRTLLLLGAAGASFVAAGAAQAETKAQGVTEAQASTATPAPAAAQDESNGNDIIVTARRSEERLQDVPISITVLSQSALTKRNISDPTQLATYVPSLSSNANFGPEKASFAIRGFTQEGKTSPSVGVYFADVIAPRANGGTTSGNGAGPGSMFDLENVQVLKGPQGTLFGRNTTGGAILLVPTKPKDVFEGSLEGSAGNYGMHRLQGVLNVPINDTFLVRGAFDWNQRDGYLNNVSGIGPKHFGNTDYIAARISVVANLTPTLENYTIMSYSHSSNNGVVPNVLACNTLAPDPNNPAAPAGLAALLAPLACAQIAQQKANGGNAYTVYNSVPNPYSRTRQWQVINTTTWQASDTITVKNIASYAEYRESSLFDLWGFNLQLPLGEGASLFLPTIGDGPGPSGNSAAQSTFTEELQIHGRNGPLDWQAGYYMELSNPLGYSSTAASIFSTCSNILAFQCTNPYQEIGIPAGSISEYSLKDTYNNKGFYAQGNFKITDKLTFTAGFRYTIDRMTDTGSDVNVSVPTPGNPIFTCQNILYFNNGPDLQHVVPVQVSNLLSPTCMLTFHQNSSRPTWLLNLEYKWTDNVMTYAKWARGYRQGGINPNNLGFPTWGPEKVDTYEIGAKTSWHGSMPGFLNLAGFYNDFRNQQLAVDPTVSLVYQASVPPQELIVNAGKSRIWGIEADGSIKPFTGLQIDASYAYLNTKLISFTTPALPVYYSTLNPEAEIGGPLELAPKNRVTVTGTYTVPLDPSAGRLSFGATFTHTDKQRVRSPEISPVLGELPPSNLLNVNVDWDNVLNSPFDLSFFMTNVTNEDHILFDDGAWGTIGAAGGHLELPRMWGFRVKWHFGH